MKALMKQEAKPGLWLVDAEVPEFGPNEVRIQVRKTAICGTDLHIFSWNQWARDTINVPMIIGHEFVGVVEAVGKNVSGLKPGDRVSGEGHITCGQCRNCRAGRRHLCRNTIGLGVHRQGAFAEFVTLPAENVFKVPDQISDDIAAIFDPLGNAVHTALSFDLVGEDVLITGAGPTGLMATAIARHAGARHIVVTDLQDYRLRLAEQLGASRVVNVLNTDLSKVMRDLDMEEGFDVALEMSGNEKALGQATQHLIHGGRLALLGIFSSPPRCDLNQIVFKGLTVKGIYGREMFETWHKMTASLQSGLDVRPVITHHLPVEEFHKGFEHMQNSQAGKVILHWD